ncbi:hypothetical protein PM082_023992 [Marasmius tenuissimus]|nr:hypothetical protein PM082_023992 [Marasmius tenuissimus]
MFGEQGWPIGVIIVVEGGTVVSVRESRGASTKYGFSLTGTILLEDRRQLPTSTEYLGTAVFYCFRPTPPSSNYLFSPQSSSYSLLRPLFLLGCVDDEGEYLTPDVQLMCEGKSRASMTEGRIDLRAWRE